MTPLANKFRVAIYDDFLDSYAKIPRSQQKKVSKFLRKFRANPTDRSIDYESISTFRDPNLRTVRIDKAYRAIVLKPAQGNLYVLLWVDHHDEAHAWAKNKKWKIHPGTGAIQVLSAEPVTVPAPEASDATSANEDEQGSAAAIVEAPLTPLFEAHSDEDLVSLGIFEELLPTVRELLTQDQLAAIGRSLPESVFEALSFLSMGETLADVRDYLGLGQSDSQVDVEDFEAALDNATTQRHFRVVADDAELEAMLDEPLATWRTYLHPNQRRYVLAHYNGPARVLGGAGTGKTVVAMHRAKHLLSNVFTADSDRILFTTFTTNLAEDIRGNLASLCSPLQMRRIEVTPIDEWVARFLRGQGYTYRMAYWNDNSEAKRLWEKALSERGENSFDDDFYREEWDSVVKPAGCTSFEEYKRAPRVGRGSRLSRAQRREIWRVFEDYRNLLEAKSLREPEDAMRDGAEILKKQGQGRPPYRAIIVDEAQDMSTAAFELIRSIIPVQSPNDIFIVGDGHQRIYRRRVVLKHAGVHIVGRASKLYINYRTTDEIRKFAMSVLYDQPVDDLDGGRDTNDKYLSLMHGVKPDVRHFDTAGEEEAAIVSYLREREDLSRVCLVSRTHNDVTRYEEALQAAGIDSYRLRRRRAEDHSAPGVRLATMHRVKGLEFDEVILAGCNDGRMPLARAIRSRDRGVREEAELQERALFYVALSRARRDVLVTSFGKPSAWLPSVK